VGGVTSGLVSALSRWGSGRRLLAIAVGLGVAGLFLAVTPGNPPGFYRDESALAYNAYTISQSGKDEHGATLPLFFGSFGDYKSPTYTYLLAGVFRVVGPSIEAARLLSAVLGLLAVGALGLLAARITGRGDVGALTALLAALNPWLFEVTRLVFEVALLPLAIVLALLAVWRARDGCTWSDAIWIGLALGLMAYAYPAGRLLAPLFAVGLLLFWGAWGWRGIARAWAVFGLTLVPLAVFDLRHPGSLSARFGVTSYITPGTSAGGVVHEGVVNYLRDVNPWDWLVHGDPNARHHVHGMGSLLVAVVALAVCGLVLAATRHRSDLWWRFAAFGLIVSPLPGTLTIDRQHTLRMVAFPIFLLVFAALALDWLLARDASAARRAAAFVAIGAVVVQGAIFQSEFRARGPHRGGAFEAAYLGVLRAAAARPGPIYVLDGDHTYIDAYWYGVLHGVPASRLRRLTAGSAPPSGATVLRAGSSCAGCPVLGSAGRFVAYIAD
jgi:Dolichyl-phosphate-mannose-protein mannosyltransferase